MTEHPCAKGLTSACFGAYPAWARQAFAYKLLHVMLPKQLTKGLPRGLNLPLVPPGVILPPGVVLPPGAIVPPGTDFPPGWSPGDPAPPGVVIPPGTVFPPGWSPGDPAPPGVVIPPGTVFPPGWSPGDPAPPGVQLPPVVSPVPPDSGVPPPLYVQPYEPGPVHRPVPGPGINEYTVSLPATATGLAQNTDPDWYGCRNTDSFVVAEWVTVGDTTPVSVDLTSGYFNIKRINYEFSLAGIPVGATIISATLSLNLYSGEFISALAYAILSDVWGWPPNYLDVGNIPSDPVSLFSGENLFNLSGDACAVIESHIGENCYIMLRENDHDFNDVPPLDTEMFSAYLYNHLYSGAGKPTLILTYRV